MKPLVAPTGTTLGEIDVPHGGHNSVIAVLSLVRRLLPVVYVAICTMACIADPISASALYQFLPGRRLS